MQMQVHIDPKIEATDYISACNFYLRYALDAIDRGNFPLARKRLARALSMANRAGDKHKAGKILKACRITAEAEKAEKCSDGV